jgi:hypothetical protein
MTYMIDGTTKYDFSIDIKAFARDLAAPMGGTVLPNDDDYNGKRYAEIAFSDYTIGLTAGWQKNERNKVAVSISPTGIKPSHASPYCDKYKLPRINVSVERPIGSVAADIVRRLIEPAKAPIAERRQYAENVDRAANGLQAAAAKLRAAYPPLSVTLNQGETHAARIYNNNGAGPYLTAQLYADGSVSIDRLGSLSAAQFERLMAALYPAE